MCEKWFKMCVNVLLGLQQNNGLVFFFRDLLYLQDCCKLEIIRRMLFIKFDFCLFFRMLLVDGYVELMYVKFDKQIFEMKLDK